MLIEDFKARVGRVLRAVGVYVFVMCVVYLCVLFGGAEVLVTSCRCDYSELGSRVLSSAISLLTGPSISNIPPYVCPFHLRDNH